MNWYRLFLPFAGAYFLSYLFRTINAVIGPILSSELSLGAAHLGFLTSAYFIAFAAAQLPLGVMLDRFGARRVDAAMLLFAAAGAAVFASGHDITTLATGRALIGLGVSACLMAALKSFSQGFPPEKLPSLTGWIMTAGTLGALVSTAPLETALRFITWRQAFLGLGAVTLLVSAWLYFGVPEKKTATSPQPMAAQWSGIRQVLRSAYFWRIAPLGFAQVGGFMAIQSLWSGVWLMKVNGYTRAQSADHLAAMSVAMVIAYALIGLLSSRLLQRGVSTRSLLISGLSLATLVLLLIFAGFDLPHYPLWIAYGAFSSFGTLSYPVVSAGFPTALAGRVNTTYNLMSFIGAFVFQWGIGILIDQQLALGFSVSAAHRNALLIVPLTQALALAWLATGKKA